MGASWRGFLRVAMVMSCGLIAYLDFGCSGSERPTGAQPSCGAAAPSRSRNQAEFPAHHLFGKYKIVDHAWCSVSTPTRSDEWARAHLSEEAAILPEVFAMRGIVVLSPRYEIRHYPKLTEGEVPTGVRRTFSDFYGAGLERDEIVVLEVYGPGSDSPRCHAEVINENTLWETWDGAWLFEWRRDGTGKNPVPLKDRCGLGGNR